jgi:hypothetical protein
VYYKAVRENDGTYTIRASRSGCSYREIVKSGVRGCNVNRTINRLYREDCRLGHS